jgi:hypothetical protein
MAFPNDLGNSTTLVIINYFFDFFFLADIFINFITALKDQNEKI